MRTTFFGQRSLAWPLPVIAGCALTVSACASLDLQSAGTVQIDGYPIIVEYSDAEPNTWRSYSAELGPRLTATPAYFDRNIRAIEAISGCPVRANLVFHSSAVTIATVDCE